MVPALQAKLLRFLEEKTFKRVGGAADIRVDVRVIAATNRNLEEEVQAGPVPRGPVLPAERAADRAAAAARALDDIRRWSTSTSTSSTASSRSTSAACRPARCVCWPATAGPATSASCATPSSGRCCSPTATCSSPTTSRWPRPGGMSPQGFELPATGSTSKSREEPGGAGARAHRLEPDARGHAARPQPR